jgi:hypothetical protein
VTMPAYAAKIRGRWRVVHGRPARLVLNRSGSAVDGGGHASNSAAESQARAINARESGYARRQNPSNAGGHGAGDVTRVWICPNGEVLNLEPGLDWIAQVPSPMVDLAQRRTSRKEIYRRANGGQFFRGAIINDRLYVYADDSRDTPSGRLVAKLGEYCSREGLSRGLVVESA